MLYLIVGIVLGAAFHEFWIDLFDRCRCKLNEWTRSSSNHEGKVVDGEVVQEDPSSASSAQTQAGQS